MKDNLKIKEIFWLDPYQILVYSGWLYISNTIHFNK